MSWQRARSWVACPQGAWRPVPRAEVGRARSWAACPPVGWRPVPRPRSVRGSWVACPRAAWPGSESLRKWRGRKQSCRRGWGRGRPGGVSRAWRAGSCGVRGPGSLGSGRWLAPSRRLLRCRAACPQFNACGAVACPDKVARRRSKFGRRGVGRRAGRRPQRQDTAVVVRVRARPTRPSPPRPPWRVRPPAGPARRELRRARGARGRRARAGTGKGV
jgi:hypothetical protein